jgi:predicted nicotinamide N-methyase
MPGQSAPIPAPDDATGRYAWPAGRRLARDLAALVRCHGLRVCDLGCGSGVVGLAALAAGAAEVVFLDGSEDALQLARAAAGGDARARFHHHLWGEAPPLGPYPLILGGDILYREAFFPALLRSIILGLERDGMCLLSDPRRQLEESLPGLAQEQGLDYQAERHQDFTAVRLRHRSV